MKLTLHKIGDDMKLVRFGSPGKKKLGIVDQEGKIRDLSSVVDDLWCRGAHFILQSFHDSGDR